MTSPSKPSSRLIGAAVLMAASTTSLLVLVTLTDANPFYQHFPASARSCPQTTLEDFQRINDPMADNVTASCTQADATSTPPKKCWTCATSTINDEEQFDIPIAPKKFGTPPGILPRIHNCGQLMEGVCDIFDTDGDGDTEPGCFDPQPVPNYYCSLVTEVDDQPIE